MKFNEKLIELRKKNALSQEELGDKIQVARQTISKWELGETTPEMDKLIKLSELFEISLDELVKDNKEEKQEQETPVKESNTQKLAGLIITILKVFGIIVAIWIVLSVFQIIISTVLFQVNRKDSTQMVTNEVVMIEE